MLFYFSGPLGTRSFTFENRVKLIRHLGGVSGVASFIIITIDEQLL